MSARGAIPSRFIHLLAISKVRDIAVDPVEKFKPLLLENVDFCFRNILFIETYVEVVQQFFQ